MEQEKGKSVTRTLAIPVSALPVGTLFAGRYQIIEDLGQGGMGRVYKALDQEIGQKVALKLLRPEVAGDEAMIERFRNELKLARQITHRNVCRVHDLGKEGGELYITMELVAGEDLKSLVRRVGRLPVGKALSVARQVSEGLAEAHRLGIIHRDLKPQNIMVDQEGNAKIMDFGIARSLGAVGVTQAGMIIGSPEYMSPEQAEGTDADQRSDIYALGVVLFEMLSGKVPFEGKTALDIVLKHKAAVPPDPRNLNPQIPPELSGLVLRCLAKEPNARYQSAQELILELDRIGGSLALPETARLIPGKAAAGEKPAKKRKTVFYAAALILAAAIVVIGFFLLKGSKAKSAAGIKPAAEKPGSTAAAAPAAHALSFPAWKNSIAVLPFLNSSPDPEQEYFCDGMTDQLTSNLSHIQELKVIARTSVMAYKSLSKDVREIGRELGVANVLEGSVRKAGNKIRVTARLINAEDGSHIWSDEYDRNLDDIFAIQDEVSQAIAAALKLRLTPEAASFIKTPPTSRVDAYDHFLRAMHILTSRYIVSHKEEDFVQARTLLEEAIEMDPGYALAYVGIGYLYNFHVSDSPEKDREIQSRAFRKAYELDPNLAQANAVVGINYIKEGDLDKAFGFIKRALEINPNIWDVCQDAVVFYVNAGLDYKAIDYCSRALELEPLNATSYASRGIRYAAVGELEKARRDLERSLELLPDAPDTMASLARVLILAKDFAAADEVLSRLEKSASGARNSRFVRALYQAALGEKDKALALAKTGQVYALLGMKEEAIALIQSEIKEWTQAHGYNLLMTSWFYDKIRDDPRFQAIVAGQKAVYEENLRKYEF